MPRKKGVLRPVHIAAHQAKKYLDAHPGTAISTAELAMRNKVSRNALQEYFKMKYKQSIGQYKLKNRMNEARRLLKTGKSIKEVTITLRYASPSSFSNAFKNYYDISASEWLLQLKYNGNRQGKTS
jgi:AraC-like DNA-binding protein